MLFFFFASAARRPIKINEICRTVAIIAVPRALSSRGRDDARSVRPARRYPTVHIVADLVAKSLKHLASRYEGDVDSCCNLEARNVARVHLLISHLAYSRGAIVIVKNDPRGEN